MDLTFHDAVLKKHSWSLEHEFQDEGRFYVHPEIEGEILIQPEGQWTHTLFDFAHEKKLGHGYNAKDLEKHLSNYKTEGKRKSKSERLINLIKMIEEQPIGMDTEISPLLLDAIESGEDVSDKSKAFIYLSSLSIDNTYAKPALNYLDAISDDEYLELYNFVKEEVE